MATTTLVGTKASEYTLIGLDQITPAPDNLRADADYGDLVELAQSIREIGLLEPLVVLPVNGDGTNHIVAGHRRYAALHELVDEGVISPKAKIPCVVRAMDEREVLMARLVENLQRQDINVVDQAGAVLRLTTEFGIRKRDLGVRVGRSAQWVDVRLLLAGMSDVIKDRVREGRLSLALLPDLAKVKDRAKRDELARRPNEWQITEALRHQEIDERTRKIHKVLDPIIGVDAYLDPRSVRDESLAFVASYPHNQVDPLAWRDGDKARISWRSETVEQFRTVEAMTKTERAEHTAREEQRLAERWTPDQCPSGVDEAAWAEYLAAKQTWRADLDAWEEERDALIVDFWTTMPKAKTIATALQLFAVAHSDEIYAYVGDVRGVYAKFGLEIDDATDDAIDEQGWLAWASTLKAPDIDKAVRAMLYVMLDDDDYVPLRDHLAMLRPKPEAPERPQPAAEAITVNPDQPDEPLGEGEAEAIAAEQAAALTAEEAAVEADD